MNHVFESAGGPVPFSIAYIADGKLYLKSNDSPPRLIDSQFISQMLDRAERARQRNDWKQQGLAWQFGRPAMMGIPTPPADTSARKVNITGLTRGAQPHQLLYALDTNSVGGLFAWDESEQSERRVLHRNNFRACDLCLHPTDGDLACSLPKEDGSANLGLLQPDGKGLREVTEGDSLDQAPSWLPNDRKRLVYQSAGIARNQSGHFLQQGPYAVLALDFDRDNMETILESNTIDYLTPKVSAQGDLYYIRRPYQPHGHPSSSPFKILADIVLFPFRLAVALVYFANWFSLVFRRKPLITAGGPPKEGPDSRYIMLYGKMVDAEKAMREQRRSNSASVSLVPKTWQLARRSELGQGQEEILASGVLSFDLCSDGRILYTNGSSIKCLSAGGDDNEICNGKLIQHVVSL